MTIGILNSIRSRDKLYKKLHQTSSAKPVYFILKERLKNFNSVLRLVINNAKQIFYQNEFNKHKNDIKKTWEIIKSIIKNSDNKNVTPKFILDNNNLHITNKKEIADKFNDFFVNIGTVYSSKIISNGKKPFDSYLPQTPKLLFNFNFVNETTVSHIIANLQPKPTRGYDGISSKLINQFSHALIKPITMIINQSLNTGIFPDQLKIAKVIPIYKNNNLDVNDLNNYRPISILPTISKIFERIVYDQVYNYLEKNSLLYISQYGFRPKHSTEFAVIELIDEIYKHLDNSKNPLVVFCDLSKAFDTLDHTILLKKMKSFGLSDKTIGWFKNYLSNRKQYVVLDNTSSSFMSIKTGVPQGSILGPLLFLLYVNDLSTSTQAKLFHMQMTPVYWLQCP